MLIAVKNMSEIKKLKAQLSNEFKMKDLDAAKKIIGMEIGSTHIQIMSQKNYIIKMLGNFDMQDCKLVILRLQHTSNFQLLCLHH